MEPSLSSHSNHHSEEHFIFFSSVLVSHVQTRNCWFMVTETNVPSTYPYITHTGPLLGTRRAGIALLEPGDDVQMSVQDMAGHRNLVLLGCL